MQTSTVPSSTSLQGSLFLSRVLSVFCPGEYRCQRHSCHFEGSGHWLLETGVECAVGAIDYMDDFNVVPSSKRHVAYVQSLNDG